MLKPRTRNLRQPGRTQRGLSLVELMVGVTVGLIVVGGALTMFARNVASSRLLLAETRMNQDLRAAVDLVTRDLRRAGYWSNAIQGTIAVGGVVAANPYSAVTAATGTVGYNFSVDETENDTLDANEQFGVRLNNGALQLQSASGTWADVTDTSSLTITRFGITPTQTVLPLGHFCAKTCAVGTPNCPTVTVRSFDILVQGRSAINASVTRSLRSAVRVRNDQVNGACPP